MLQLRCPLQPLTSVWLVTGLVHSTFCKHPRLNPTSADWMRMTWLHGQRFMVKISSVISSAARQGWNTRGSGTGTAQKTRECQDRHNTPSTRNFKEQASDGLWDSACLKVLVHVHFVRRANLTLRLTWFLASEHGSLVGQRMQDYKSLCAAVKICLTLINMIRTHIHTHREHFHQQIWKARPDELKNSIFLLWNYLNLNSVMAHSDIRCTISPQILLSIDRDYDSEAWTVGSPTPHPCSNCNVNNCVHFLSNCY